MRAPIAAGHSRVRPPRSPRLVPGSPPDRVVRAPPGRCAPGHALAAIRSIRVSPFPEKGPAVYFAGYDANKAPAHNTAWILRASTTALLGTQPR
jgi:hypothetical protein